MSIGTMRRPVSGCGMSAMVDSDARCCSYSWLRSWPSAACSSGTTSRQSNREAAMNEGWIDPEQAAEEWAGVEEGLYQVIALDPGGTTGWSLFQVHPDAMNGDPSIPVFPNIEWWTAGEFTCK